MIRSLANVLSSNTRCKILKEDRLGGSEFRAETVRWFFYENFVPEDVALCQMNFRRDSIERNTRKGEGGGRYFLLFSFSLNISRLSS